MRYLAGLDGLVSNLDLFAGMKVLKTKQHTKLRNPYLMPMFVMLKKHRKILS